MADDIVIVVRAEDNFSGVLGNFGSIITGVESAIRLAGDALRFFGDMALEGLDAISSYERLGLALETLVAKELLATGEFENMTDALAQATPQAQILLDQLQEIAIKSPFTLEGVANAFRMAQAYGFTADEAMRLTQAMIDFAAGTGASEQTMSQIALALGQIEAKGKLAGQEVLQLVNAGLPVTQILADAFGKTTAEIEKMRSDGLIPAQDAIEAITVYLETNFAGAAERQATSWAGLMGTFADIKQMGLREFFGGMFDVLQPLAVTLSEFLQTEGLQKLGEWGTKLGEFTEKFVSLFITPGELIHPSEYIGQGLYLVNEKISEWTPTIMKSWDEIWAGMSNRVVLWATNIDWLAVDQSIADSIAGHDWKETGAALRQAIGKAFVGEAGDLGDETGIAIANAWSDFITGLFNMDDFNYKLSNMLNDIDWFILSDIGFTDFGTDIQKSLESLAYSLDFVNIGKAIGNGIINGFKAILGISSPSTVFRDFGINIIQGLIEGWNNAIGSLLTTVGNTIEDIGRMFGIDLSGILGSSGTASLSTGSTTHAPGGGTTGGLSSGQVVNNYYGPVYFGATGEPNSYYDCPSPNPLVAASGNQLVVTGF